MLLDGTKKTLLNSMSKIFDDSPSRRADYGKISSTLKEDYSLQFYSTRWVENECLAKKNSLVWEKIVQTVIYCNSLRKQQQPGANNPSSNTSYQQFLENYENKFAPLRFAVFGQVANKLS